jgi:hypothetical protein
MNMSAAALCLPARTYPDRFSNDFDPLSICFLVYFEPF